MLAEFLGTLLLAAIVVGSGIAAARLSPGNAGLELTENALATALGLFAIIVVLGPVSGAHLNPVVSLVDAVLHGRSWIDVVAYIPAQILGCCVGAILSNLMFGEVPISISTTNRLTPAHFLSEIIATAGLIIVIFTLARTGNGRFTPAAVAAFIGAAYLFTSSTGFANPAVTVGRMLSDSFAGIAPNSVLGFIGAQLLGGCLGLALVMLMSPKVRVRPGDGSSS